MRFVSEHPTVKALTLHVFRTYVRDRSEPSPSQTACSLSIRNFTKKQKNRIVLCIRPMIRAVQRLTRIVVGVLQKTSGFAPRPVRVVFMVDRVLALGQVFFAKYIDLYLSVTFQQGPMPTLVELPMTGEWVLRMINLSVDRRRRNIAYAGAGGFLRWCN